MKKTCFLFCFLYALNLLLFISELECCMSRLKLSLLTLSLAFATSSAFAADFSVNPLKVILTPNKTSEVLTIHNAASSPLRLEIDAKKWSMSPTHAWVLSDTDDLIYTPELIEVAPKSDAVLRVGSDNPPDDKEQSYRLLMTEIPDTSKKPAGNGVNLTVRTQLSLPVFIEPPVPVQSDMKISQVTRTANHMVVTLNNEGTQRLDAQAVSVDILDASGKSVEKQQVTSSYALAGAGMNLDVNVKPESCVSSHSVQLTFTNPVVTLTAPISDDNKSCGKKD